MTQKEMHLLDLICVKHDAMLDYIDGNLVGIRVFHPHCLNSSVEVYAESLSNLVSKLRSFDYGSSIHICPEAVDQCCSICLEIANDIEITV